MLAHDAFGGLVEAAEQGHGQGAKVGAFAGPLSGGEVGAIHANLSRHDVS